MLKCQILCEMIVELLLTTGQWSVWIRMTFPNREEWSVWIRMTFSSRYWL